MSKDDKKYLEQQLASLWNFKFKDAMVSKSEYTKKWKIYEMAYNGEYFKNKHLPNYRSDMISNYIFSIVETIRPIMLNNDPKFQSLPRHPEGMKFANDLQDAFIYEWDREGAGLKLYRELINTLVLGTSVFFIPWDRQEKNVKMIPVSSYNIFPDPLATTVEDAEYIIYASYKNIEVLRRLFPGRSDELFGSTINYSELVYDNDYNSRVDNQILILEVWTKDYEDFQIEYEEKDKQKYPNGRVITVAPELGLVLSDKANPYKDGNFPFVLLKDYDVPGKFWGEGEVSQLLSPQKHMNDLNSAIIDNAKATANMPWIIDKNAGIAKNSITSRPGLIIRKNPGTEVKRDAPPAMPMYVINALETYKDDIEEISGVFSSVKGDSATGVYTAQGILSLQEASQTRIKLKVRLMEEALSRIALLWFSRMKQFWKEDKWIRVSRLDGSYDIKKFTKTSLEYDYDIKVSSGSTMPVNRGAMLDLMIRLSQTIMPDGQPLVDREAVLNYLPAEIRSGITERMEGNQSNLAEIEEAIMQTHQALEELNNKLEQIIQESRENDKEIFDVIEDITDAIEKLNEKILQLEKKYDIMVKEKEESDRMQKIKTEAYNKGFKDSEEMYEDKIGESIDSSLKSDIMGVGDLSGLDEQLPDEILEGLESMSDEELALLLQQNPDLINMIK